MREDPPQEEIGNRIGACVDGGEVQTGKRYVTPGNPEPTRRVSHRLVPNKSERTRYRPTNHPHASDACFRETPSWKEGRKEWRKRLAD